MVSHSMFVHQHFAPQVALRVRRAHDEIKALGKEVSSVRETSAKAVWGKPEQEEEDVWRFTRIAELMPPAPLEWSVTIGEIVHNLRSALDNLACALVFQHSQLTCEHTSFPIFSRPELYQEARKRKRRNGEILDPIYGIDPEASAIIEGLQPYHHGQDFGSDPLWVLHELSNIDKHRLFHLTTWAMSRGTFEVEPNQGYRIIETRVLHHSGPVKHGAPLAEAIIQVSKMKAEMKVKENFTFDIAFDQAAIPIPAPDEPVGRTLVTVLVYVAGVVESFERFLPSPIYVHMTTPGFVKNPNFRR